MPKEQNQGQSKSHEATRLNPVSGQTESKSFTQEEWRQRDKTEGWERPDEVEDTGEEVETDGGDDEADEP